MLYQLSHVRANCKLYGLPSCCSAVGTIAHAPPAAHRVVLAPKAWDDRLRHELFPACASFDGVLATGLLDVTRDLSALDGSGWWAVVATFEGEIVCARFEDVSAGLAPERAVEWARPSVLDDVDGQGLQYEAAVERIRELIAEGAVYQVNLCRVLSAPIAPNDEPPVLAERLNRLNPAPFGGVVHLPDHGVGVVSASPELFVRSPITPSPLDRSKERQRRPGHSETRTMRRT